MDLLTVRRVVTRPNHGGFYCHGTTTYTTDGPRNTYSRSFACPCGEPFLDGDRVVDTDRGTVHVNCAGASC